jgi:hypothetical protein
MEKDLHIGISQTDYIRNKKNLLVMQTDLLSLLEKLKLLKETRAQKESIYRMLVSSYASLLVKMGKFERSLPRLKVKAGAVHEIHHITPTRSLVAAGSNPLENELRGIQAKLRELNAL